MTFDEYQAEAIKTRRASLDAVYLASKLLIESGEAAQHVIKEAYRGKAFARTELAEELGDVAWHIANLCDMYDLSFDDIAAATVRATMQRITTPRCTEGRRCDG